MKLGAVLVFVPDLEEARDFYARVLGLTLRSCSDTALTLSLGSVDLHVFRTEGKSSTHRHGRDAGTAIAFEVSSLDAEIRRLRDLGVRFLHGQPAVNMALRIRYAAFAAPGGNVHELIERY